MPTVEIKKAITKDIFEISHYNLSDRIVYEGDLYIYNSYGNRYESRTTDFTFTPIEYLEKQLENLNNKENKSVKKSVNKR